MSSHLRILFWALWDYFIAPGDDFLSLELAFVTLSASFIVPPKPSKNVLQIHERCFP